MNSGQFDSVTTLSTAHPTSGLKPTLRDGCLVSNVFSTPPDSTTGVTAGTVGTVVAANTVKRHGFRYAENNGKYYPLSEAPNGEYTLASLTNSAGGWEDGFGWDSAPTWTTVSEDRFFVSLEPEDGVCPRGCYVEFQFAGSASARYGVAIGWVQVPSYTWGEPLDGEVKVLPAEFTSGTIYESKTSFRGYPTLIGSSIPVVYFLCDDANGDPVEMTNLKIIIF